MRIPGVLVLLLMAAMAAPSQAHPEDAQEFFTAPRLFPIIGEIDPNATTGFGVDVPWTDNEFLPAGTLVSMSAFNDGPGILSIAFWEGQNRGPTWDIGPDEQRNFHHVMEHGGAVFFDANAIGGGTPTAVVLFVDFDGQCEFDPEGCIRKEAVFDVEDGQTVFQLDVRRADDYTTTIVHPGSLPLRSARILSEDGQTVMAEATAGKDGITVDWTATSPGIHRLLVTHGEFDQQRFSDIRKAHGFEAAVDSITIEPVTGEQRTPGPPVPVLVMLLALVAVLRRRG